MRDMHVGSRLSLMHSVHKNYSENALTIHPFCYIFIEEDACEKGCIMELNQLQYFCVLARVRHFTHAAEEIHMSQSALSRAITKLEEELGTNLFVRGKGNTVLTPEGECFLVHAERALAEITAAEQELQKIQKAQTGIVNLACMRSQSNNLIPQLLLEFHQVHPGIRFILEENSTTALGRHLQEGTLDLIICAMMPDLTQTHWQYLFTEELLAVLPVGHPFANRRSLNLVELADYPLVTTKPEYSTRYLTDFFFAQVKKHPQIIFEGDDLKTAASMVAQNMGVSLLPKKPLEQIPGLCFIPIANPLCSRDIGIAWHSQRPLSPAATLFRDFVTEHIEQIQARETATP